MLQIQLASCSSLSSEEDWLQNTQQVSDKAKVRRVASEIIFPERSIFVDHENKSKKRALRPKGLSFREGTKNSSSRWLYSNFKSPNEISTIQESPNLPKIKRKKENSFNETTRKEMQRYFENQMEKIDVKYIKNYIKSYYKDFLFESYKNNNRKKLKVNHKNQLSDWDTIYKELIGEKKLLDPIICNLIQQRDYLKQRCEERGSLSQWAKDTIILLNILISHGKNDQITLPVFLEVFDLSICEEITQAIQYLLSGGKQKKKKNEFDTLRAHIQNVFFYNNYLNEFREFYDQLIKVNCVSNQIYKWKGEMYRIQDITLTEAIRSLVTENTILRDVININGEEYSFSDLQEEGSPSNLQETFLIHFLDVLYNVFNCFEGSPEDCTKTLMSLAGYTSEKYETTSDYSPILSLLKMCSQSSWNCIEDLIEKYFNKISHYPYHLKRTSVGKLKMNKRRKTFFVTRDAGYSIYLKTSPDGSYVDVNAPLANITFKWTIYWSERREQWIGRLTLPDGIEFTEHSTPQNRSYIFECILQL